MDQKVLLKNNLVLFLSAAFAIIAGGFLIFFTTTKNLHLFFNSLVNPALNLFFITCTYLGDGYFIGLCLLIILMFNLRLFLSCGVSYGISSLLVQSMKNFIYPDALRPRTYFEQNAKDVKLVLIDGIETLGNYSFPSGHTTAAFSLFFTLALVSENKLIKIGCFFIALLVGFSRIYLSQHFFEDVYTGMIIGIICSFMFFYFFYISRKSGRFSQLNESLFKIIIGRKK